jgi:hypothetical protein
VILPGPVGSGVLAALASALRLLALATVFVVPANAQVRDRVWLGLGLGGGGGSELDGAAASAQLVFQHRAHYMAIRALLLFDVYGDDGNTGEIGVLYGRMALRSWGHAGLAGGLAYTDVQPCPHGGGVGCHTVGVPLLAEAAARLNSVLGVGVQAFVNLNSVMSYRGALVFLQLGWIP